MEFNITKLKELKSGDIFQLGDKPWDDIKGFTSINYYDDKKSKWVDAANKNTRTCIHLFNPFYGNNDGGFSWLDENAIVYLPKFPVSTFKKSIGKPCILHPNGQLWHIFPFTLNEINIQSPPNTKTT